MVDLGYEHHQAIVDFGQTLQAYIVGFMKEGDPNRGSVGPEFPIYKDGIVIFGSKGNVSMIVPEGEVGVGEDLWVDGGTRERCKSWGEAKYWDGYEGGDEKEGDDGSDGNRDGNDGEGDDGNDKDGDNNEDDRNENNDDQDKEDADTRSGLKLHSASLEKTSHPSNNWRNKRPLSRLQNADFIAPTFSDIFKTKNDDKKVEWHAEWNADWISDSKDAFANTEGSDNKGKDSEIEEKEELR